jgi:hypothetical protein
MIYVTRLLVLIALVCLIVFFLTGCKAENTDPRKGRVVDESNCLMGDCYYDYKVCVGPDLLVAIDNGQATKRWFKNSEECRP